MLDHNQPAVYRSKVRTNNVKPSDIKPYGVVVSGVRLPVAFFALVSMGQKRMRTPVAVTPHFTQQSFGTEYEAGSARLTPVHDSNVPLAV